MKRWLVIALIVSGLAVFSIGCEKKPEEPKPPVEKKEGAKPAPPAGETPAKAAPRAGEEK